MSAPFFHVYDKYADTETTVSADAEVWVVPVRGTMQTIRFAAGPDGALQRKFVILTQSNRSPSAVDKIGRRFIRNWPLYVKLLADGPARLRRNWIEQVTDIEVARAGKIALRLACSAWAGPWRPEHLPLIKGLDPRTREASLAEHGRLARRESVLSVDTQAKLVRVLDEYSRGQPLTEQELESLVALALYSQHGIRPVQLLSLRTEHVHLFKDASGDAACVISFHAAKQPIGAEFEMARQVRPEWAPFVARLLSFASEARRPRLFATTTSEQLWTRVKSICARWGVEIDFTAYALRHTAAQALADAGHDRYSIQQFLGHTNVNTANKYVRASRQLGDRLNAALGASKLYGNILSLAEGRFISVEEMTRARADKQIGAVVGERLVAGVGLCRTGQPHCPYNPVTSCYGCSKFMPSLDRSAHEEAVAGMREQVLLFASRGGGMQSPAYLQLMRALSGAQEALEAIDRIRERTD